MFSYVNMCNCILNFWHLILYFPLHIHMEKLSLKITYYFIARIATEYEAKPTTQNKLINIKLLQIKLSKTNIDPS